MTEPRTERNCRVSATIEVEVWVDHGGRHETRKLEVSLRENLDSSKDIREAFERLAEIAVQGASR